MAGRASIVGAAVTHVGNVREHNEDAHYFDADLGLLIVCDGMGGHAAGEVASAIAIKTIRDRWADSETQEIADVWLDRGTAIAKKQLLAWLRDGVLAAHQAIVAEAERDTAKSGMGTTMVAAMLVGSELIFAHAGDSRAYMVRDGISTQLTEDHTLLQRLLAAGIDVDVSGDGAKFRSMLTNALGIGQECKVSTFVVPLADGDRFMLCSDGISEYVEEAEVGEVLVKQPSPARAAQKLVELALERGGADNATAVVVRVLEAGDNPLPAAQRRRDDLTISLCDLWTEKVSPQQRLRAMRIAVTREIPAGDKLPAHSFGDRVAWIVVEGEVNQHGEPLGPGSFIYPESLVAGSQAPANEALAVARTEVRAVSIRSDDFKELCDEDPELGEALLESLAVIMRGGRDSSPAMPAASTNPDFAHATTDPSLVPLPSASASDPEIVITPMTEAGSEPDLLVTKRSAEPDMEVSLEMEADLPPERVVERAPVAPHSEDSHPEITVSRDDGSAKVTETVTETSEQTLSLTVEEASRSRPVTADDGASASGTIDDVDLPADRPRRVSDGWGEE
ncbi:MAG: protein phosphatase 2C domain-containing protein [Deltaproteobacteria bacterium]|nr:protein phosphatase 2C domain-containing protein [Deltaproteobacteria bacterium]